MVSASFQVARWESMGLPGSIAQPSHALLQLLQRKERQDRVVTAITSSPPPQLHSQGIFLLLPQERNFDSRPKARGYSTLSKEDIPLL